MWQGAPSNLFDSCLCFTGSGRGFIAAQTGVPANSAGFWISDRDLVEMPAEAGGIFYEYSNARQVKYVGLIETLSNIPAGTLLRVSLARWWKPEDVEIEERCYLQLSGWYL